MFTKEQREKAVGLYLSGKYDNHYQVCDELGYPAYSTLPCWVREARKNGAVGGPAAAAEPKKPCPYAVKAKAVGMAREGRLTQAEIADELGIRGAAQVSLWPGIANEEGMDALMPKWEKEQLRESLREQMEAEDDTAATDCADGAAEAATEPEGACDATPEEAPREAVDEQDEVSRLRAANERLRRDLAEARRSNAEMRASNADLELDKAILEETLRILKKDPGVDPEDLPDREKTQLVDALRQRSERGGVDSLLERVGIARSTYYYERGAIAKGDKYAELRVRVRQIFYDAKEARGYRHVTETPGREGEDPVVVSEKVVREIMREEGLVVIYDKKRRRRYDSYKGEISDAPDNLVNRDFHADAPNTLWLTDITESEIAAGKACLSPTCDCCDTSIVSWRIGEHPDAKLANGSLEDACAQLREGEKPTIHSDRGCHYRWPGWVDVCEEHGLTRSMSKKGCSPDNAAAEGLFGRIKNEFFYYRDWSGVTTGEFMEQLDEYLVHHDETRPKESLGWMTPSQVRQAHYEKGQAA